MIKYVNGVSKLKELIYLENFIVVVLIAIRFIFYYNSIDYMIVSFLVIAVVSDFVIFYLRKQFYTTFYDDNEIFQRFLFKKKSIKLNDVKHILILKNCIALSDEVIDISTLSNNIGKDLKKLENKVIVLLGETDIILSVLAQISYKKINIIKATKSMLIALNKYGFL